MRETSDLGLVPEAELAAGERDDRAALAACLKDDEPSVRWWDAIGLGNLGAGVELLRDTLNDAAPVVRVAAARGLGAAAALAADLQHADPWSRLYAAIALDEMAARARPAAEALRAARAGCALRLTGSTAPFTQHPFLPTPGKQRQLTEVHSPALARLPGVLDNENDRSDRERTPDKDENPPVEGLGSGSDERSQYQQKTQQAGYFPIGCSHYGLPYNGSRKRLRAPGWSLLR